MNNYYIRKAKRRCAVPGCRNTEVNRVTKMRDSTKAVFICDECFRALSAVAAGSAAGGQAPRRRVKSGVKDERVEEA